MKRLTKYSFATVSWLNLRDQEFTDKTRVVDDMNISLGINNRLCVLYKTTENFIYNDSWTPKN